MLTVRREREKKAIGHTINDMHRGPAAGVPAPPIHQLLDRRRVCEDNHGTGTEFQLCARTVVSKTWNERSSSLNRSPRTSVPIE
jgi:hypothetical protein